MGLRADSGRPQRVSGSARTDSQRAESARNPIASHVNFGDDSALSAFTRTQWTAALTHAVIGEWNEPWRIPQMTIIHELFIHSSLRYVLVPTCGLIVPYRNSLELLVLVIGTCGGGGGGGAVGTDGRPPHYLQLSVIGVSIRIRVVIRWMIPGCGGLGSREVAVSTQVLPYLSINWYEQSRYNSPGNAGFNPDLFRPPHLPLR